MSLPSLSSRKFAIMVSHGFDESAFVAIQKMMLAQNISLRVISPNAGLVNGVSGGQVVMSYPVDVAFNETLAIDFDALIIPAGDTHIGTLSDELHTVRIVRAFMRQSMPILVQDNALDMVGEIIPDIDVAALKAQGALGQADNLIWASSDAPADTVARSFFGYCAAYLADQKDNSAAA
jgi:hypothetical protein